MIAGMGLVQQLLDLQKNQIQNQLMKATMASDMWVKKKKNNDSGLRNKIIDHDMNSQTFTLL